MVGCYLGSRGSMQTSLQSVKEPLGIRLQVARFLNHKVTQTLSPACLFNEKSLDLRVVERMRDVFIFKTLAFSVTFRVLIISKLGLGGRVLSELRVVIRRGFVSNNSKISAREFMKVQDHFAASDWSLQIT